MTADAHTRLLAERDMLAAIDTYFSAQGHPIDGLRAVEVRVVAHGGEATAGGRINYRMGQTHEDLLILAAPRTGTGAADAPMVPTHVGV